MTTDRREKRRQFYLTNAERLRQERRDRYWMHGRERSGIADRAIQAKLEEHGMKPKTWKLPGPDGAIYPVKCYTVGELAKLLLRDAQTIRKWERNGIIPEPTLRDDVGPSGRRLYTEDQVKVVLAARDAIRGERFTSWKDSRFPGLVQEGWEKLAPWGFDPESHEPISDPTADDRAATVPNEEQ